MTTPRDPSVGEYIADELAAREWSRADLAARTGMSHEEIAAIIDGTKRILVKDAEAIGRAFGTSAVVWLRLQKARERKPDDER